MSKPPQSGLTVLAATVLGGLVFVLPITPALATIDYVKVCDSYGEGWFYQPGKSICQNADTGETRQATDAGVVEGESDLLHAARSAKEGVALGIAMQNASVDAGKQFGAAVNWGVYEGEAAISASGAIRLDGGFTVNGTLGYGLGEGNFAARAGVNFAW